MATKKRMAYSYEDSAGNRHSVIVVEDRKFGWIVTTIENGKEKSKRTGVMGSLMTVMNEALNGHSI